MDKFHFLLLTSRLSIDLKQGDIAQTLNLDQATISSWENGVSLPSEDKLERIANAYKIDISILTAAFSEEKRVRKTIKQIRRSMNQRSPRR